MVASVQDASRLSLTVDGAEGDTLLVGLQEATELLRFGVPVSELVLRDDGTQGDESAGDGTFTVDGLSTRIGPTGVGSTTLGTVTITAVVGGQAASILARPRVSVRTLDPAQVAAPVITSLPDLDMQVTSRVAAIITDVEPADFIGATEGEVVGRFYEAFPDDRDWLVVYRAPTSFEAFEGQAIRLANTVTGIGIRRIAASGNFGSRGRLELVVETVRDFYWPRGEFEGAFCLLTHELTHRWAAELSSGLAVDSHWTDTFLRDASGFGWQGKCRFNRLELYLAGRIPADSVPGSLTSTGLTIADVIRTDGPRVPAVDRDVYTVGFVIVAPRPLSDTEMAYFHHLARQYVAPESPLGLTFEGATGGRIRLDGEMTLRTGNAAI